MAIFAGRAKVLEIEVTEPPVRSAKIARFAAGPGILVVHVKAYLLVVHVKGLLCGRVQGEKEGWGHAPRSVRWLTPSRYGAALGALSGHHLCDAHRGLTGPRWRFEATGIRCHATDGLGVRGAPPAATQTSRSTAPRARHALAPAGSGTPGSAPRAPLSSMMPYSVPLPRPGPVTERPTVRRGPRPWPKRHVCWAPTAEALPGELDHANANKVGHTPPSWSGSSGSR